MRIKRNAKAVIAALGTAVTALSAAAADDLIDAGESTNLVSAVVLGALTVYGVWQARNASDTE